MRRQISESPNCNDGLISAARVSLAAAHVSCSTHLHILSLDAQFARLRVELDGLDLDGQTNLHLLRGGRTRRRRLLNFSEGRRGHQIALAEQIVHVPENEARRSSEAQQTARSAGEHVAAPFTAPLSQPRMCACAVVRTTCPPPPAASDAPSLQQWKQIAIEHGGLRPSTC